MIEQSDNITDLAIAMAKAQGAVEVAVKGRDNPHFKSKYADLSSVWDACREALTANGLSVIQSPGHLADGRMEMTTMLLHASGQWLRGSLTIPLGKVDAQAYGSATTYARRYALAAFVGVAPDDDDGAAATKAKPTAAQSADKPPTMASLKREGIYETLQAEVDACASLEELEAWNKRRTVEIKALPPQWYDALGDRYQVRSEELQGADTVAEANREMDEAFRAVA